MSDSLTGEAPGPGSAEPKRVLVLGGSGMLGQEAVRQFSSRKWFVSAPSHRDLDVTWVQHLENLRLRDYGDFDWVVNCAAYTKVDQAESEAMAAMNVNGIAPGTIAAVCEQNGWKFLHVSTDFLFDGESDVPYTEENVPSPLGIYGRSKLFGEHNVQTEKPDSLIVRTAWLFGPYGKCFPRTIIEAWLAEKPLRVVTDQTGSPTYAADLARVIGDLMALNVAPGVYNAVGPDMMTWHQLAVATLQAYAEVKNVDRPIEVTEVTSAEFHTAAKRPPYSVLSTGKITAAGIQPMRNISEALTEFSQRLAQ